jgi:hypothetical protein
MNTPVSGSSSKKLVPIFVISWAVFFIIGAIGHFQVGNSILESMFKSLQLFHLHYHPLPGSESTEGMHTSPSVPWTIEVARFGAGLWALTLLPALIGLFFEERIRIWWVKKIWKKHYVVCGECSRTMALVRDLDREKKRVVLISTHQPEKNSLPKGVIFLEGNSADQALLERSATHRAEHIICLHENDRENIETLATANKLCSRRPHGMPPLECSLHLSDMHLQSGLHQVITRQGGLASSRIKENLFNYYEFIARHFSRNFPLPPAFTLSKPNPVHIVIVGFGAFGQNVALKTVKMAQQLYPKEGSDPREWEVCKPIITIVDPLGEKAFESFRRSYPNFTDYCTCKVLEMSTTDNDFLNLGFIGPDKEDLISLMVFCLENESVTMTALSTLLDISRIAGEKLDYIYLRIAQPEKMEGLLHNFQPLNQKPEVVYFASDKEIFNADVLLNRSLDIMAKAFHNAYLAVEESDRRENNLPPAAGKQWEELSADDRQSNREAADHTWAKLRLMGYRLKEIPGGNPQHPANTEVLEELRIKEEELARLEHYRWMVWRVLNGWQYGTPRDNIRMLHPDIREYEELANTTKEKDRANIRAVCDLIRNGWLEAER